MVNVSEQYALTATLMWWGPEGDDDPEMHAHIMAAACNRCRQLCCDGYPCYPWEIEELEQLARDELPRPDADYDEVEIMVGGASHLSFVWDLDVESDIDPASIWPDEIANLQRQY